MQAEEVLQGGIRKFITRFQKMEELIDVRASDTAELEAGWQKAKEEINKTKQGEG